MNEVRTTPGSTDVGNAKIVYILYLVGLAVGITGIVGAVLAYVNRGDGSDWLDSHYRYQIRTFWIGGVYIVVGTLLSAALIGFGILLFWAVWLILRCVKGMKALEAQEPVEDVESWLF